jgi:hypothetical protein
MTALHICIWLHGLTCVLVLMADFLFLLQAPFPNGVKSRSRSATSRAQRRKTLRSRRRELTQALPGADEAVDPNPMVLAAVAGLRNAAVVVAVAVPRIHKPMARATRTLLRSPYRRKTRLLGKHLRITRREWRAIRSLGTVKPKEELRPLKQPHPQSLHPPRHLLLRPPRRKLGLACSDSRPRQR